MGGKGLSLSGELVSFRAADEAVLAGFLCRPKRKTKTAIIHLHGLNSAFYRPLTIKLASKLAQQGIAVMSIQQRGSYNEVALKTYKKGKKEYLVTGGSLEKFEDCVLDIKGAVKYLKSIGIRNIYLEGQSTGCQKSVYYAMKTRDRAVKGLILLAPGDDYNLWRTIGHHGHSKREFEEMVAFAKSKLKKDPMTLMATKYPGVRYSVRRFLSFADLKNVEARIFNYDAPKLKEFGSVKIPVLAILGTKDEFLTKPAKEYLRILGKNTSSPNFMGLLIKGAGHGLTGREPEVAGLISKWVRAMEKGR
jgi:pimeloyl-ACP methyl ester carboxylesterase